MHRRHQNGIVQGILAPQLRIVAPCHHKTSLPMYIYSTMRRGVTPEINAIGTLLIAVSIAMIFAAVLLMRSPRKK
jgi:ABC-type spermidine/putrescine transport system permease subunit II